jgi:hypothetical protein
MRISLEELMNDTTGMNPVQFEAYCDTNQIQIEWLDVTLSDFNDGFYNVTLTGYNDINVFASDGSPIEFQG